MSTDGIGISGLKVKPEKVGTGVFACICTPFFWNLRMAQIS